MLQRAWRTGRGATVAADDAISSCRKRPRSPSSDSVKPGESADGHNLLAELVRGRKSLGAFLGARGCRCTPSPDMPEPVSSEAMKAARVPGPVGGGLCTVPQGAEAAATYFSGGYTTRRYAAAPTIPAQYNPLPLEAQSGWAATVAAVQLETAWSGAREDATSRRHFAEALRASTEEYLCAWTGWELGVIISRSE